MSQAAVHDFDGGLLPEPAARRRPVLLTLVAEPDPEVAQQLALALLEHNVHAAICADGAEALLQAGVLDPDVLLVSAALPVVSGATLVRVLRRRRATPVIVGVADGESAAAADALAAGATACVRRPYRLPEVLPILAAARPEFDVTRPAVLACGPLHLDDTAHEVRVDDRSVTLPPREFDLLRYLMVHAGRVVSRDELYTRVWGAGGRDTSKTVTVHVRRLRSRLGDDDRQPALIQTVRGLGYRLCPPQSRPVG